MQTSLHNYSPISILSIFNKLLEKLMHKRMLESLEKKKVIYCKQSGFCVKHSMDHAILSIVDLIQHAIDCQEFSYGICLDFSKAFYTVNHNILIEKLDLSWHLWCKQRLVHLLSYQKKINLFPWGKPSLNLNLSLVVFLKAQFSAHYYFFYMSMILKTALKF